MAVDRIVDDELFQMAQELRARRDPGRNSGREASSPLLLAGLLRCARCGDTASPWPKSSKSERSLDCMGANVLFVVEQCAHDKGLASVETDPLV
jgi:hypothetical protein